MIDTEKAINEIIKQFNFNNVHKAMIAVGWTWYEPPVIPTIEMLKQVAIDGLNHVVNDNVPEMRTGGFTFWFEKKDNSIGMYFVLEDMSTEFIDLT